jgi:hypothetical protein
VQRHAWCSAARRDPPTFTPPPPPLAPSHSPADAANLAASRGSSSDSVEIDAATGRWEMRDAWADAVEGVRGRLRCGVSGDLRAGWGLGGPCERVLWPRPLPLCLASSTTFVCPTRHPQPQRKHAQSCVP